MGMEGVDYLNWYVFVRDGRSRCGGMKPDEDNRHRVIFEKVLLYRLWIGSLSAVYLCHSFVKTNNIDDNHRLPNVNRNLKTDEGGASPFTGVNCIFYFSSDFDWASAVTLFTS